jgi:hypothetical protein
MSIEDAVRAVLASLDEPQDPNTNTQDETASTEQEKAKRVIHVDKYALPDGSALFRLPSGEAVLVPGDTTPENELEANSVESVAPTTPQEQATSVTEPPTIPLVEEEPPQDAQPKPTAPTSAKRRVKLSFVLLCMLAAGAASYLYLLPLTASATVTITPKAKSLHTDAMFTIATNPKAGQVQGSPLVASSFTKSKTVPATGHAHDDATQAAGVLTFYNADSQAYTIPAGTSFTVQGVTVVTDTTVTVQAAVPPSFGTGITQAHAIQAGTVGNIAAHAIDTRCCGSEFITATNTSAFSGGQDARTYSFIQSSDIQNAATDLLSSLTPQATETLQKEARPGEQVVTPLCSPRTQESAEPGAAAADVTVSVTQTCSSIAYLTDSLNQVATSILAHMATLSNFEEVGTTQVTVNGSTYTNHTATLKVSVSGVWVYRFTQAQEAALTRHIAGESQESAKATLENVDGVAQVSIHVQRLDFKDLLPTNPQRITIQFFYIVS